MRFYGKSHPNNFLVARCTEAEVLRPNVVGILSYMVQVLIRSIGCFLISMSFSPCFSPHLQIHGNLYPCLHSNLIKCLGTETTYHLVSDYLLLETYDQAADTTDFKQWQPLFQSQLSRISIMLRLCCCF